MGEWLRQPLQVTRRAAIAFSLVLGLLAGGGVIAGAAALRDVHRETVRATTQDQLTSGAVAAIARRVFAIESPTAGQLLDRIERALRVCQRRRSCRRSLRAIVRRAGPPRRVAPADQTRRGKLEPTRRGDRRDPSASINRPNTSRRPGETSQPPAGATPPGRPPAPVSVHVPATPPIGPVGPITLPPVCTPVVDVNC